jgi:2-dehydropantoate 2-reductase
MNSPRILVLGAGSIGGYYGGRLAEAGTDVTFLVREPRQKALERDGLRIESPYGNATLKVKTVLAPDLKKHVFDLVILTCKAYDLSNAIDAIADGIGPSTAVLPLLNGVAQMDILNDRFGKDRVLGGTAKIQANVSADGIVRQLNDWRYITFGEQSGEISPRVKALAEAFAQTKGIVAEGVSDIMQRMWEKLVHLSTAATMTCLMRANVGEIVRTPDGGRLFLELLSDISKIAALSGYEPSAAFTALYRETFSDKSSGYATSMLRDIERRGRTEVDHIIGFVLARARSFGLENKTLELAYTHIKSYEQRLAARRD